jgi:CIC family chloride channel protein
MKFFINLIFKGNGLIVWIQNRLTPKQFVIFSAILIGLSAGLAAVILKLFVHWLLVKIGVVSNNQWLIASLPVIGISLCVIYIHYINGNKLGKGLANILFSIAKKSSILPKDQTYSHIISSALTVGFGGSAGLESPIVTTGSAIGSNFGLAYKLNYKERTLLLACGAAAGIAGAFNTPIAGVLFALEVLLVEANISAFIPILIASAAGGLCSKIILHEDILLNFVLREPFNYKNVPFYMLLGIVTGFFSYYYSKMFLLSENFFRKFEKKKLIRLLLGGSGLFLMIMIFPPLFGEGYIKIKQLSESNISAAFAGSLLDIDSFSKIQIYLILLFTILVKPFATGITLGSGGNGGNFAPSLFVGAFLGYLFSSLINELGVELPVSNFTLVAMAGILSGIFHAPLTGIFLIAEITGGYELIIPLMVVAALSYAVSKYFMPLSIDMLKLSEKEKIITTSTDAYLLSTINISEFIERDFTEVPKDIKLRRFVELIAHSKRNIFPVVNNEGNLVGLISIDDIREIMFKQELYDKISVSQLMSAPKYFIDSKDDVNTVMKRFSESNLWNIPVLSNNKYIGFVSKSTLLEKYRSILVSNSIDL